MDTFVQDLETCVAAVDVDLFAVQNRLWEGFLNYSRTHGTSQDPWKPVAGQACTDPRYMEKNLSIIQPQNITICEPCNTLSNIAYLHSVTRFCKYKHDHGWSMTEDKQSAVVASLIIQSIGSTFMHGSETNLGQDWDTRGEYLVAMLAYQHSISQLPEAWRSNPIIRDFSLVPKQSAEEVVKNMTGIIKDLPVEQWKALLDDMPYDIAQPIAAMVCSLLSLVFPPGVVDDLVKLLVEILHDAPGVPELMKFLTEHYLPTFRNATAHISLGKLQRVDVVRKGLGSFIPMLFGILFQEEIFKSKVLLKPEVNRIGAKLMPFVFQASDFLTGFKNSDTIVARCDDGVYPGAAWCRPLIPHAKWHESTANGFFDLFLLAEYLGGVYKSQALLPETEVQGACDQYLPWHEPGLGILVDNGVFSWRSTACVSLTMLWFSTAACICSCIRLRKLGKSVTLLHSAPPV